MKLSIRPKGVYPFLITLGLYVFANTIASNIQVLYGVSIFYPATAVAVACTVLWGWKAALGVFLATLLTPWYCKETLALTFLHYAGMGGINALEGLIPYYLVKPRDLASKHSIARFCLWGVFANTALSSALGNLLRGETHNFSKAFGIWWLADAASAFTLGIPLYLLLCQIFRCPAPFSPISLWEQGSRKKIPWMALFVLFISSLVAITSFYHIGTFYAFAVLYLIPLGWASLTFGLMGGTLMSGCIALCYTATVYIVTLKLYQPYPGTLGFSQYVTVYTFLFFFMVFALITGYQADDRRRLLAKINGKRQTIEKEFQDSLVALSAAIEAKDAHTYDHVRRTAFYAVEIGKRMGLTGEPLETLRIAAILHDVGKLSIPDHILGKAGPFTLEEKKIVQEHVEIGAQILSQVKAFKDVVPLVKHHQERWDGDIHHPLFPAYPDGLKGEEIPLGARILAVVDAYDAMTHDRPYRRAMNHQEALEELKREAGKQFDPQVVEVFIQWLEASQRRAL